MRCTDVMRWLTFVIVLGGCHSAPTLQSLQSSVTSSMPDLRFESLIEGKLWGHRAGDCSDEELAAVRERKRGAARDRALAWVELGGRCYVMKHPVTAEMLRSAVDFATALLDAGLPHDCASLLTPLTTSYAGGLHVEDPDPLAALATQVHALGNRCAAAHEAERSVFAPVVCPGLGCFEFVADPRNPVRDPDSGSYGQCRAVTHDARALLPDRGPMRDESFCCNVEKIAKLDRGWTYLRITGGGRVCGGGTSSRSIDAVYRVDGNRLVLEKDDSVTLH